MYSQLKAVESGKIMIQRCPLQLARLKNSSTLGIANKKYLNGNNFGQNKLIMKVNVPKETVPKVEESADAMHRQCSNDSECIVYFSRQHQKICRQGTIYIPIPVKHIEQKSTQLFCKATLENIQVCYNSIPIPVKTLNRRVPNKECIPVLHAMQTQQHKSRMLAKGKRSSLFLLVYLLCRELLIFSCQHCNII